MWAYNPVSLIYLFAAGVSFIVSYLAWKMRPAKGAAYFSFMMLSAGIWVSAYVFELFSTVLYWKIFFLRFGYAGMAFSVYLWFIFVTIYTQYDSWLTKKLMLVLAIIPVFTLINIIVAPEPNLLHKDYSTVDVNGLKILETEYAGGFYLWTAFAYSMMGGGLILMVFRMLNMPKEQRKQVYLFISAIAVIIIPNLSYILRHNPIYPYDPTPLSIAVVGVLFLISLYRHKLLGVLPVAHAQVFKNMRSAVIVVDSFDIVQEINPAAKTIFKVLNKDVAGKSVYDLLPDCKDILNESKGKSEVKAEISLDHLSSTFELKINTLKDSRGRETGRLILLFDITDRVKAVNELDAYARTVAHDLKNPLNVILGHAYLLSEACEAHGDPDLCTSLDGIKHGAMHMNDIVESLLLLARVRNVESVEAERLNMGGLVQSSINRLKSNIESANANISVQEAMPESAGVALWVEEVWTNLLSNAVKYGGDNPQIVITAKSQNEFVYYFVKDNGIGLNKDQQKEVFAEFTRMHKHKSEITGHGLGLSIVKRVVEKLGGEVGVQSTPGEGSTFFFSLPR